MIDLKVLKLERNYLTNCESKFKGTSNQDVPFFFLAYFIFQSVFSILFELARYRGIFCQLSDKRSIQSSLLIEILAIFV